MAEAAATPAPVAAAPALKNLFPTKKKGFKATNFTGDKQEKKKVEEVKKTDDWEKEEEGVQIEEAKLRVGQQVEKLNTDVEVIVEDKPKWATDSKKDAEDGEEKVGTKQYPSLARSVQPEKGELGTVVKAPQRIEGLSGVVSKFDALNRDEEDREEARLAAKAAGDPKAIKAAAEAAAKKREKEERKKAEKEAREAAEAAEKAAKNTGVNRKVMVDGKPDTDIRPDIDRIQAKYDSRRKMPVVPID